MVRIRLYGQARQLAGSEEVSIEIEGQARLEDVLRGILKGETVAPSKYLQAILVNGRNCIFMEGLDTPIHDGDLIEILPMVSGG